LSRTKTMMNSSVARRLGWGSGSDASCVLAAHL